MIPNPTTLNEVTHEDLAKLLIDARNIFARILCAATELEMPNPIVPTTRHCMEMVRKLRTLSENAATKQGLPPVYFAPIADGPEKGLPR
jgi:hypothetical protein